MVNIQEQIEKSTETIHKAIEQFDPYAVVAMFSGGTDSLTSLKVLQSSGINIDALVFVNTHTGIDETVDFVRMFAEKQGLRYLEASAGTTYVDYLHRKGFWGRGVKAHALSYQSLKATPLRKLISKEFRQRKRNRRVLLFNGVREEESKNRKKNYDGAWFNVDPGAKSNIWINHIHEWTKAECLSYLRERSIEINPVSACLHRSGECMCGTMQSEEDRRMASFFYPKWGKRLDDLEADIMRVFPWGWGQPIPKDWKRHEGTGDEFLGMCRNCTLMEE